MSNSSHLGSGSVSADQGFRAEMAAFDELPAEMRRAIAEAPIVVGAVAAKRGVSMMGAARAAAVLREALAAQVPSFVAQAYGPDHPQARRR